MSLLSLEITTQIDPFVPEIASSYTTPWWFLGWYSCSVLAGFYIDDKKRGVTDLCLKLCIHNQLWTKTKYYVYYDDYDCSGSQVYCFHVAGLTLSYK